MRIRKSPHVLYLNVEFDQSRKPEITSVCAHKIRKEKRHFHALAEKLDSFRDFFRKKPKPIFLHIPSLAPIGITMHISGAIPAAAATMRYPRSIIVFDWSSIKEFLKAAVHKLFVSVIIFSVLFFSANFSAYAELIGYKWKQFFPAPVISEIKPKRTNFNMKPVAKIAKSVALQPFKNTARIPFALAAIAPPDTRLLIPRIGKNVPVVTVKSENLVKKNWKGLEKDIMEALRNGVIHYPGTALPGQSGNVVITGHSSYFPWDKGRFKDVFALLTEVKIGDTIVMYHKQKKYVYEVTDMKEVYPNKVDVLKPTPDDQLTLITCVPLGTDLRRLVVTAKLREIKS